MEVLEPEVTKLMNFMYFQVKGMETKFVSKLVFLYSYVVCSILCAQILNLVIILWKKTQPHIVSQKGRISNAYLKNFRQSPLRLSA